MARRREIAPIRSSAAEYLTFVAASGNGGVEAVYADENVWLSQKMMAELYDVDVRTVNYHLKTVFADSELEAVSVIQRFRITVADGNDRAAEVMKRLEVSTGTVPAGEANRTVRKTRAKGKGGAKDGA